MAEKNAVSLSKNYVLPNSPPAPSARAPRRLSPSIIHHPFSVLLSLLKILPLFRSALVSVDSLAPACLGLPLSAFLFFPEN